MKADIYSLSLPLRQSAVEDVAMMADAVSVVLSSFSKTAHLTVIKVKEANLCTTANLDTYKQ